MQNLIELNNLHKYEENGKLNHRNFKEHLGQKKDFNHKQINKYWN